jgi:ABC-2 type transport system permease protein
MNTSVIRLTLRTRRLSTFWFQLGIVALGLLIMGLWPLFKENWDNLSQAMGGSEVFGGTTVAQASAQQNTFYSYFSSQYTTTLMLVMAYFGVWFGAGLITRDFGAGTLDVLLAAPISRTRFLLSRIVALFILTVAVIGASLVAILIGAAIWAREIDLSAFDLLLAHVQMLLFTLAVAGGGLLLATLILQPGRTYGLAAGIIVIMFVLLIVADIASGADWLGKLSVFGYWNPVEQLGTGEFIWRDALVMAGAAVVTAVASLAIFRRRDIVA